MCSRWTREKCGLTGCSSNRQYLTRPALIVNSGRHVRNRELATRLIVAGRAEAVRAKVLAAIWGAELASYRWDNEGDAYVTLRLKTGIVNDVMGQRVDHKGEVIEVEGMGAQHDDFANSPDSTSGGSTRVNSTITEGNLDIPVSSTSSMVKENVPGGGSQLRD